MKIVVDAMGSDHRPLPDVEGAVAAAREYGVELLLVGPAARIEEELKKQGGAPLIGFRGSPAEPRPGPHQAQHKQEDIVKQQHKDGETNQRRQP